eukprot:scaffold4390_cov264-Pinguiococcus_pyrenoidosus.AAC.14
MKCIQNGCRENRLIIKQKSPPDAPTTQRVVLRVSERASGTLPPSPFLPGEEAVEVCGSRSRGGKAAAPLRAAHKPRTHLDPLSLLKFSKLWRMPPKKPRKAGKKKKRGSGPKRTKAEDEPEEKQTAAHAGSRRRGGAGASGAVASSRGFTQYPKEQTLEHMDTTARVAVKTALVSQDIDAEAMSFVEQMRMLPWQDRSIARNFEPMLQKLFYKAQRHKRVEVVDVSNVWLYLLHVHDTLSRKHAELLRQHRMARVLVGKASGRAWTQKAQQMERIQITVKRIEQDADVFNVALRIFTSTQMAKQVEILRDTRFTQVGGATGEYIRRSALEEEGDPDGENDNGGDLEGRNGHDSDDMDDEHIVFSPGGEHSSAYSDSLEDKDEIRPARNDDTTDGKGDAANGKEETTHFADGETPPSGIAELDEEVHVNYGALGPDNLPTIKPRAWNKVESKFGDLETLKSNLANYEPSFEELLEQEKRLIQDEKQRKADGRIAKDDEGEAEPVPGAVMGAEAAEAVEGDQSNAKDAEEDAPQKKPIQSRGKIERDRKRRRRKAAAAAAAAASAAAACRAAAIIAEADAGIGPFAGLIAQLAGRQKLLEEHAGRAEQSGQPPPGLPAPAGNLLLPPAAGESDAANGDAVNGDADLGALTIASSSGSSSGAMVSSGAGKPANVDDQMLKAEMHSQSKNPTLMQSCASFSVTSGTSLGKILQEMATDLVKDYDTSWLDDVTKLDPGKLARCRVSAVLIRMALLLADTFFRAGL